MNTERLRDRFVGAILGTMVGDALGAPVEGWNQSRLDAALSAFPELPPVKQALMRTTLGLIVGSTRPAFYTDDTQMTLGVAESLISCHEVNEKDMARRFAENFDPRRGYGQGTSSVLTDIRNGIEWDEPAGDLFQGEGSHGNGAAMRMAPIGLLYHDAPHYLLRAAAERSARITHTHPLGKEGAVIQASVIAAAIRHDATSAGFDSEHFVAEQQAVTRDEHEVYRKKWEEVAELLKTRPGPAHVAARLGNDVSAPLSVPAAIYSFLVYSHSFEQAVSFAVRLGGDTDTIAAMTGAISGAFHGANAIPRRWLERLENGTKGRDYSRGLADELFEVWQKKQVSKSMG